MTSGIWTTGVNLFSDLNPNMEVFILPLYKDEECDNVKLVQLASKIYYDWFENEKDDIKDMTVIDYLEYRLEKSNFILGEDYKMFSDIQWDRMEILI